MPQPELDYRKIRRLAEEQLQRDKFRMRFVFFVVSLIMFIVFTCLAWGLYLSNAPAQPFANHDDPIAGALIILTVGGFMGVLFQMIAVATDTKSGERQMRERAYGRVMNEELMRLGEEDDSPSEKAKHMMQLSDDGELEAISGEEDQDEMESQPKYSARQ